MIRGYGYSRLQSLTAAWVASSTDIRDAHSLIRLGGCSYHRCGIMTMEEATSG